GEMGGPGGGGSLLEDTSRRLRVSLAQLQVAFAPACPVRAGVETEKLSGATVPLQEHERHGAGAEVPIVGIGAEGGVAFACGLLLQARVAQNVGQGEMGIPALGSPSNHVRRPGMCGFEVPAFHAI